MNINLRIKYIIFSLPKYFHFQNILISPLYCKKDVSESNTELIEASIEHGAC